jgi:hypothetical protein
MVNRGVANFATAAEFDLRLLVGALEPADK